MTWNGTCVTEEQVANAALLCIACTKNDLDTFLESDSTAMSLAVGLIMPPLYQDQDILVVESKHNIFCCFKPTSIPQQILEVTERQIAFKYGGRVHAAFDKRSTRVLNALQRPHDRQTRQSLLEITQERTKTVVFCAHGLAGGVAHLSALKYLYGKLPVRMRMNIEDVDEKRSRLTRSNATDCDVDSALTTYIEDISNFMDCMEYGIRSIAFGSPCLGDTNASHLFHALSHRYRYLLTVVNEFDCIPNVFDIAQTSALLSNTTSRFLGLTKSVGCLLGMLPTIERVVQNGGIFLQGPVAEYTGMTWGLVHKIFTSFQDRIVLKTWNGAGDNKPCGQYIFLSKESLETKVLENSTKIAEQLQQGMRVLSRKTLWQHVMPTYVAQIARRNQGCCIEMNYYERLKLMPDATPQEIKTAYKSQALKWHPDRWVSNQDAVERKKAETMFKLLAEAYETLNDPERRLVYDKTLREKKPDTTWDDEFMEEGTVHGMSMDEAISLFRKATDMFKPALSRFSNSSGVVVVPKVNPRFQANNHDNIFAPNKMRVVRQDKSITYITSEEMLTSDHSASTSASNRFDFGTVSVVGGAVVVGAGVALLVHSWSKYSDSARRRRQAEAVREMPFALLHRLLRDAAPNEEGVHASVLATKDTSDIIAMGSQSSLSLEILEEFYDCLDEVELATLQQNAEETFFDCLTIAEDSCDYEYTFPVGAFVSTPFGVGAVLYHTSYGYAIDLVGGLVCYVQSCHVTRGAVEMVEYKENELEKKRCAIAEHVIEIYRLDSSDLSASSVLEASRDAAVDTGVKAAGGVALSSGLEFVAPGLGLAAAPITVAAILVDIGKDYLAYCKREHLTAASARLSMQNFRLKAGHHVVSGTTAAAGASLGLYSITAATGYWTGVAALGPVGFIAATSAAIAGGIFGYAAGAHVYANSTADHFTNLQEAAAEIERLEIGAKVLFSQFDPNETGFISTDDCKELVRQLCSSLDNSSGCNDAFSTIESVSVDGRIPWAIFWNWVSCEAIKRLESLDATQAASSTKSIEWWKRYVKYFEFSKSTRPTAIPCHPACTIYPSVIQILEFKAPLSNSLVRRKEVLQIELAQIDALTEHGWLSQDEAYQLELYLKSTDRFRQKQARETISKLQEAWKEEVEANPEHIMISSAFTAEEDPNERKRRHLDVFCSLLSNSGLDKVLLENHIPVPEKARRDELHGMVLALLAPSPSD